MASGQGSHWLIKNPEIYLSIHLCVTCLSEIFVNFIFKHIHTFTQSVLNLFHSIQRRAAKIILELRDFSYEECLKECGLTILETRRLRGDQIEVYQILNGFENIDRYVFLTQER